MGLDLAYIHIVKSRYDEWIQLQGVAMSTQEVIPLEMKMEDLQGFLKAIASETRQRILLLYADGRERTVGQVAAEIGLGQPTASEHLALLKRGGLLTSWRVGKEVYYRPDRQRILRTLRQLTDLLSGCCPE